MTAAADELVVRATGRPMSIEPYLAYLEGKYRPLYGLALPAPPQG